MAKASAEITPVDQMHKQMELAADVEMVDAKAFVAQIKGKILAADTAEDIFAAAEAGSKSSEDYLGIPHRVESVAYGKSGFQGGAPVFSVVKGWDALGEEVTYTIGAEAAQTQLWQFQQKELLPMIVVLTTKASRTNEGNTAVFYRAPTVAEMKSFD